MKLTPLECVFIILFFPFSLIYLALREPDDEDEDEDEEEGLNWDNDPDIR